jgi:CRISPR system Cascade subunit CasB
LSRKKEIEEFINKKLTIIKAEAEQAEGKAIFANLRRGIGRKPGEIPELFGILLQEMPEEFMSESGTPTKEEWACYVTLTLFALHQQGMDVKKQCMNTSQNVSIGTALAKLAAIDKDVNSTERMLKRLKALATAKDMNEIAYHLRGIIKLLKRENIALNYKSLAMDLYDIQYEEKKVKLCLKWGQDFYRKDELKKENGGNKND